MTQPRKRATVEGGERAERTERSWLALPASSVLSVFSVAASIPIPNPNRPPPASRRGSPVARKRRARVNSGRQSRSRPEDAEHSRGERRKPPGGEELLAGGLDSLAVAHARGAGGLAAEAAEAGVEVLDQRGIVRTELAALERAHEHDPAAGAVRLVAGGEVGRAGGKAEPAVNAGIEGGVVGEAGHR